MMRRAPRRTPGGLLWLAAIVALGPRQGECDKISEEKYQRMRVDHLWDHFNCDAIFAKGPRPIHQASDWMLMRKAYESAVGSEHSSIITPLSEKNGFHVPVEAKQADEEKGRGIFATAPVKKGQKVWSTSQTARFEEGSDYRNFLAAIPADFACDVLQWAYVQAREDEKTETEKAFVSVDLDEGSFINSFEDWVGHGEQTRPNLGCDEEAAEKEPGGCNENYFALQDIAVGDELLLDYGGFAISHGWQWFGL